MPRELIREAAHSRDRSLGWLVLAWWEHFCLHGPGDVQGRPLSPLLSNEHGAGLPLDDELAGFTVDCYALASSGRRLYDSAFFSRAKGRDKSGHAGRLVLVEALGPCRFAGWAEGGEVYEDPWGLGFRYEYAAGEPMGRPVRSPFIRCLATEEGQTGHTYDNVVFNLTDENAPLAHVPGLQPGLTRTFLPGGGEIRPSTASSAAKDGGKETFVVADESHLYVTPELRRMYATVRRNADKRKAAQPWVLETSTMYAAGEDSVAEDTHRFAQAIRERKARGGRLLFDHREGPADVDLNDRDQLTAALVECYGPFAASMDLERIVNSFWDPRNEVADMRRYFLNQQSSAVDAWLAQPEWAGCTDAAKVVADRDVVVLGFDGSRRRARGVTDATALVGCRVGDGHLFELRVWEQPTGPAGEDWQIPTVQVDAEVRSAFDRFTVVGFYADPAKWETQVAAWEAAFTSRLKVKVRRDHPIEWWMTGGRATYTVRALEQFHSAVVDRQMTHDGSSALTRHVLNARRRKSRFGLQIAKEHPDSPRKIDAAVAAVLAWQARVDALAAGVGAPRVRAIPRRIR